MKRDTAIKLLSLVRQNYETIAADFDKTRQKEAGQDLKRFVYLVKPGQRILDVGCGNGRLISVLEIPPDQYLGIDNSDSLLAIARRRYPEYHFSADDILNLEKAAEASYDVIFCLAVLPHIPSTELRIAALRNMKEKLSPGGSLVLSAWNLWSPVWRGRRYRQMIIKNWCRSLMGRAGFDWGDILFPWKDASGTIVSQRYYHAFRARELTRLAKRAGLVVRSIEKDDYNYWLILN